MIYADRYVITGRVESGENKDKKVWVYWSPEGGGWWQWGPEAWAHRFESTDDPRLADALRCAKGETKMNPKRSFGPWFNSADIETVQVERVPAIVTVSVR